MTAAVLPEQIRHTAAVISPADNIEAGERASPESWVGTCYAPEQVTGFLAKTKHALDTAATLA